MKLFIYYSNFMDAYNPVHQCSVFIFYNRSITYIGPT